MLLLQTACSIILKNKNVLCYKISYTAINRTSYSQSHDRFWFYFRKKPFAIICEFHKLCNKYVGLSIIFASLTLGICKFHSSHILLISANMHKLLLSIIYFYGLSVADLKLFFTEESLASLKNVSIFCSNCSCFFCALSSAVSYTDINMRTR